MKMHTYQRKVIFLIVSTIFAAVLTSCQTPGWTNNPNAWKAFADFSKPDQAPFTGAAPMRPIIYQTK